MRRRRECWATLCKNFLQIVEEISRVKNGENESQQGNKEIVEILFDAAPDLKRDGQSAMNLATRNGFD